MRVRKLDANGDYSFGNGQGDFYRDQPEAPAQCVLTRLELFTGDWFLDTSSGTAWRTKVLGMRTASTRDVEIRARVLSTQGVSDITAYNSQVNRSARSMAAQITIDTIYGAYTPAVTVPQAANVDVRQGR